MSAPKSTQELEEETKIARQAAKDAEDKIAREQGVEALKSTGDFRFEDNSVYFKGIHRSLRDTLVKKLIVAINDDNEDEYDSLKNFWFWTCLNPRAEVADLLFDFLNNNCLRLNKEGFFYALRNVVTLADNTELVQFVSNAYNKVKAVWKKKASEYEIFKNELGEFVIGKNGADYDTHIGNLEQLYLDLPDMKENRYTDAHTRTFDIRVGQVVKMDPKDCHWSTADCNHAGLKFVASL